MMPVVSHPRTSNYSRGNGQNHRQNGYESSNRYSSYSRRGSGYDTGRGGYDTGRGGYDAGRGGYDGGRGGYDGGRGGYDSGRGGYDSGRGGYDSSRGYNGYSSRGRSQRLDLKVSNLQPNATLAELREFFSGYGHLEKITMDTRELGTVFTGTVYLLYRPPPETEFWKQTPRFHGKQLRIEITSPPRYENEQNFSRERRNDFLQAKSLEMGLFVQQDTFVKEWKTDNDVKFKLNYSRRSLEAEFGFIKGNNGKTYRFRLETYFNDVDGDFQTELDTQNEQARAVTTIRTKFPPKLSFLNEKLETRNQFEWNSMECWQRMTAVRVGKPSDKELQQPTMPSYPNATGEELGRWYAYRITFILDKFRGVGKLKEMLLRAAEFNLVSREAMFSGHINIVDGSNMKKYVDRSMLDFDVLYMLECIITHGFMHDYNLNDEFMEELHALKKEAALAILEKFYQRKTRIYNPLEQLKNEISKLRGGDKQETVPSYCVMMRKVVITPSKMYILPPTMETSNRTIRYFKDHKERFLRVQFNDENGKLPSANGDNHVSAFNRVHFTLVNGIQIGNRKYEFLAFSSSQLRDRSCWFFAPTDKLSADDIRKWMGNLSGIKVVAKYAARMGQCFSSTRAVTHLPVSDIQTIDDITRNGYNFSDGCGKISPALCQQIAEVLDLKSTPSAVQFRLGGYKGVLCMSPYVREKQIQVRPSQRKFDSPHTELEVIRASTFLPAYLNRQAITLLSTLKVPDEVFMEMRDAQVEDLDRMLQSEHSAMQVLLRYIDEWGVSRRLADMVRAGFMRQQDPWLANLLSLFRTSCLRDLKNKAKIFVDEGAFLLGVVDETHSLKEDEIFVCISDPNNPSVRNVVTGTCVVFRNPCFHPGDVRVVTAVKCPELKHLVDVLVFPATGYRDLPNMCSGGDLDGDDFTVIWDKRLVPPEKNFAPMEYQAPEPFTVEKVTVDHIKRFFVNYILNDNLGQIANAHVAKADKESVGAMHGNCLRLAQLHSEAVDFPKTGVPAEFPKELRVSEYPDFMDKADKPSYESKKILGKLYRSIQLQSVNFSPQTGLKFDQRLFVDGYEQHLEDARLTKRAYDADVSGLMNQYGVATEHEVVSGFIVNSTIKVEQKKPREVQRAVSEAMTAIRRNYRKKFEKDIFAEYSVKSAAEAKSQVDIKSKLEAKAYAWYYVTYHPSERGDEASDGMISFPWTVDDHLCDIAIRNSGRVKALEDVYRGPRSVVHTSYQQRPSSMRRNGSSSTQIERVVNVNIPGEEPASDGGISRIRMSLRRNGI